MAGDWPPGKISLPFKTMNNTNIADLVLSVSPGIVLMTKMIFYKKINKLKYYSESKIWRQFSPGTMAGYPKTKWFLFCLSLFLYYMLLNRRLTTIDYKELLYLMPVFFTFCFFALITFFFIYNNNIYKV